MAHRPLSHPLFTHAALLLLVIAVLPVFSAVLPVRAQNSKVAISSMEIDLWPEYDRASMLVIYHITLSPEITLPVDLTLSIPTAAGEPYAVAVKETNSGLFNVDSKRKVNGDVSQVTFTATMPEIQVEYYDPRLTRQGAARHYEYFWPGDYAVQALQIKVQEPLGATDMRTTPSLGNGVKNSDGFVYYTYQVGSLTRGQNFTLALDYSKSDNVLSAEQLQVKPSVPVKQILASQSSFMTILPWLLALIGVVLILGGIFWYWQTGKGQGASGIFRRRRKAVVPGAASSHEGHVYCHQCGKRAMPNDRFCRTCGSQLSKET